ncbi:MAG: hypothetical protein LDL31_08980 [Prosthecobacter sp.]|nr:hypothetical protein [Prosthecobacter sp.]
MKTLLTLLSLLFISIAPSQAMTLLEAMQASHVTVTATASSSYSETRVVITNRRTYALDIDFSTVCLVQANSSQRVGLAYEKSTFSYYLRLAGSRTFTLFFSSRCLDQSRSSPSTGVAYSTFRSLDGFPTIIHALRNYYSQSQVWQITDNSSITAAWRAADPRNVVVRPVPTSRLDLSSPASWRVVSPSSINFQADQVANLGNARSGSLRLRVWAARSPYYGGTLSGYILGTLSLSPLNAGYAYNNINRNVTYSRPPAGSFYTVMTIEEYTTSGWFIRDYLNFPGTTRF